MICIPASSTVIGFTAYTCLALYLLIGGSYLISGLHVAVDSAKQSNGDPVLVYVSITTGILSVFYLVAWPLKGLVNWIFQAALGYTLKLNQARNTEN